MIHPKDLLTTAQLAELLSVATVTIEGWRQTGSGPAFVRLGNGKRSPIRYRRADVEQWLAANTIGKVA